MGRFIDRERELAALRDRLARPASLSLVYGQRRTGKTFLLQHLLGDHPGCVYFLADESTGPSLLDRFRAELRWAGRLELAGADAGAGWGAVLTLLAQEVALRQRPLVLVLDEVQYLFEAEPSLPTVLQRLWDAFRHRAPLHLILCGSALGTLARLGEAEQPLHGRFDLRLELTPFTYAQAACFAPAWSRRDRLRLYGTFGGLARHLAELRPEHPLEDNLVRAVLDHLGPLHEAALDLLRTERLSSLAEASAVLGAIALGESSFGRIAARAGLKAARLHSLLKELQALRLVRRETRFGDRPGSRYTRYRCEDPFVDLWFRLVAPNRGALMGQSAERVFEQRISPRLDERMGPVFERIVRDAVLRGALGPEIGLADEAAPHWSRDGQTEIDLVARAGRRVLLLKCKWQGSGLTGLKALHQLRDHASRYAGPRGETGPTLGLASGGGFTEPLRAAARLGELVLLGPSELLPEAAPSG